MKNIPTYSRAPSGSSLIGRPNLFHLWLQWLKDLGGSFEPVRDLSEPKPPTGRRDPDRKPRDYPLTTDKYTIDNKGTIRRKIPDYYPEAGE